LIAVVVLAVGAALRLFVFSVTSFPLFEVM
jgi:hypothetical protein